MNSQNSQQLKPRILNKSLSVALVFTSILHYSISLTLLNLSKLTHTMLSNVYLMLLVNFWPKLALHFTLIEVIFCHIILKNLSSSHICVSIFQLLLFSTLLIQTLIKRFLLTHLNPNLKPLLNLSPHTPLLKLLHNPNHFTFSSYLPTSCSFHSSN